MEIQEFEKRVLESKVKSETNRKKYDTWSIITTMLSVLCPILIVQTSNYIVRLIGAGLLFTNYFLNQHAGDYFRDWLGHNRYYNFLRVEFFKYQTAIDQYNILNDSQRDAYLKERLNELQVDSNEYMEILDLDGKKIKKNIIEIHDKIGIIKTNMNTLSQKLLKNYPKAVNQKRFEYYVKSRYLDQLLWFYKRINPNKAELKPADVKKSVFFNFIIRSRFSFIYKAISLVITIFTSVEILTLIPAIDPELFSIILVSIATVFSIISSMYAEIDKVQKNRENCMNYYQTTKALMRIYDNIFLKLDTYTGEADDLAKIQAVFVSEVESTLLHESIKWRAIQQSKGGD
jgi:hypothetical protein